VLFLAFDSFTWLPESTVIVKLQSGLKHAAGIFSASRWAEPPGGIAGVAKLNDCPVANWTVVVDTGDPAFPWFFTETTTFIALSITLQNPAMLSGWPGDLLGTRSGSGGLFSGTAQPFKTPVNNEIIRNVSASRCIATTLFNVEKMCEELAALAGQITLPASVRQSFLEVPI
jgi:hypothetical protein